MKKFVTVLIALCAIQARAGDDLTNARIQFERAVAAYNEGNYNQSLESLNQIPEDYWTFAYYYNLGNVYFKLDSMAPCILAYERAALIRPKDENLKANIQLSNQRIIDKIDPLPSLGVQDFWTNLTARDNLSSWTYASILFFFLCFAFLAVMLFLINPISRRLLILGSAMCFCGFLLSYWIASSIEGQDTSMDAIIFSAKTDVKSEPGDRGTDVFILHEGTKVHIRDEVDDWCEIRIADGKVGWVRKSDLVLI